MNVYIRAMLLLFPFFFYLCDTQDIAFLIMGAWLALPLAWKGIRMFRTGYATYDQIIPAQALTIQSHLLLATLMLAGIRIGHFIG